MMPGRWRKSSKAMMPAMIIPEYILKMYRANFQKGKLPFRIHWNFMAMLKLKKHSSWRSHVYKAWVIRLSRLILLHFNNWQRPCITALGWRSEEHTSELQSRENLV